MSISDEIRAEIVPPGSKCQTCVFIEGQDEVSRAEWDTWIVDVSVPVSAIHRVMRRHGFARSASSVEKHRSEVHRGTDPAIR